MAARALVEQLIETIEIIPPETDPAIYALLQKLKSAYSADDEERLLQAARAIEQHALYKYEAVVLASGPLCRVLEASAGPGGGTK